MQYESWIEWGKALFYVLSFRNIKKNPKPKLTYQLTEGWEKPWKLKFYEEKALGFFHLILKSEAMLFQEPFSFENLK